MPFQQYPFKGGIPSGTTAQRPSNPVAGDTYYNGTKGIIEIYTIDNIWVPCYPPAPNTPTIVSVTDVGTGYLYSTGGALSVVVTPSATGGTTDSYVVSNSTGAYSVASANTTILFSGLPVGSYQLQVEAANSFGRSAPTALSSAVNVTTAPQAPTIGTASTSTSNTNVTVSWTLNNNGGKNLTAITVTPYLNGTTAGTPQNAASTSATSMTFTGLTNNSSYTFKVKATNANGVGEESAASNSVTIPNLVTFDYLVVAGGGAGGVDLSGADRATAGGGAGGVRCTVDATGGGGAVESAIGLLPTGFTVTVGAGAAQGASGSASVFSNINSTGGGGGGYLTGGSGGGANGGSGGGSSAMTGGGGGAGSGTAGQGYGGGNGTNAGPTGGGGGGGAGTIGGQASSGTGGNGGNGVTTTISGSSLVYGGGGGGGAGQFVNQSQPVGSGGNGGGASGATGNGAGGSGTANRGGGGGGQGGGGARGGAAGGSGVVILRYPSNTTLSIPGGLTATTNTSGNNKITTFNAGTGTVTF